MAMPEAARVALQAIEDQLFEYGEGIDTLAENLEAEKQELTDMILAVRTELKTDLDEIRKHIEEIALAQAKATRTEKKEKPLMNMKGASPGKFTGKHDESFRAWSQDLKAYCNALYPGVRKALVCAEGQDGPSDAAKLQGLHIDNSST